MKNSRKPPKSTPSDLELNPLRKLPKLGKFIVLAVILHLALAFFLFSSSKKKEEEPVKIQPQEVKEKPPVQEEFLQTASPGVPSSRVQKTPMVASKPVLVEEKSSVLLGQREALSPKIPPVIMPQPLAEPLFSVESPSTSSAARRVERDSGQRMAHAPMHIASGAETPPLPALSRRPLFRPKVENREVFPKTLNPFSVEPTIPSRAHRKSPERGKAEQAPPAAMPIAPLQEKQPLLLARRDPSILPQMSQKEFLVLEKLYTFEERRIRGIQEEIKPQKSLGPKSVLLESRQISPSFHTPVFQPQIRLLEREGGSEKEVIRFEKKLPGIASRLDKPQQIMPPQIARLTETGGPLSSVRPSSFPRQPPISLPENLFREDQFILQKTRVGSRKETIAREEPVASQVVLVETPPQMVEPSQSLFPSPQFASLQALPSFQETAALDRMLTDIIHRLVPSAKVSPADPKPRLLAKNLTYRDLGVESEGTKFFSALIKAKVKNLDEVEVLSLEDVSKVPHLLLQGEIWEAPEEITLRLRLVDNKTGQELNSADSRIPAGQLLQKVDFAPPAGKSLHPIQKVVALMKQFFSGEGDFQLRAWPDKGVEATYREGEMLQVHVLAETNVYLQVDYYQADGTVVHLLPNPKDSNFLEGGKPLIIGAPGSGYIFPVSPPFGQELLTVIASQTPLGEIAQQMIEPADAYVEHLAAMLQEHKAKGKVAGAHFILLTKARETKEGF